MSFFFNDMVNLGIDDYIEFSEIFINLFKFINWFFILTNYHYDSWIDANDIHIGFVVLKKYFFDADI